MKKLIIIFLCCNVYMFAQNRKEQIEQLTFKLDSTNTVLANERNSLNIKIIEMTKSIELLKKKIETTQTELASKQAELVSKQAEIENLNNQIITLKEEIQQLNQVIIPDEIFGQWVIVMDGIDCSDADDSGLTFDYYNDIAMIYGHEWSAEIKFFRDFDSDTIYKISLNGEGWAGDRDYKIDDLWLIQIKDKKLYRYLLDKETGNFKDNDIFIYNKCSKTKMN